MLYLRMPMMDKSFCLVWAGEDVAEGERFRALGFANIDRSTRAFLQGDGRNWKMWEFWTGDNDLILSESLKMASLMGLPLEGPLDADPPLKALYPNGKM